MINGKTNGRNALEIINLRKEYSDPPVIAVDGISFEVKAGEIFSFLGPNGAGKSTTISMAATQLTPSNGSVKIFEEDIQNNLKSVRKRLGICPQDLVFYENLTVMENVMFFGKMHSRSDGELRNYANFLIEQVGLLEKKNILASKLSGGMKRRLNVIIALVNDPELLFLDEPTAGLDPQTRRLIWDFILQLKAKGKTIFLTTHYMDEADFLSDRVAIIDHGKIVALDSPFDLKRKYSQGDVIEFKFQEKDEQVHSIFKNGVQELLKDYDYNEEDHLFRIALQNGIMKIPAIIEIFQKSNLHLMDMNVKANSLENVFLNLTGRKLRE